MLFLLEKLIIQILVLAQVSLQSGNFNVSTIQNFLLAIQFCVQIGVLLFPINQQIPLIINLLSQCRNHPNISFNSTFKIIFHPSFFIGHPIEVLLKIQ
jgi:hypothetical protein